MASTTVPYAAKASCKSFSVTLKSRFPTNNLVLIVQYATPWTGSALTTMFPRVGSQTFTEPASPEDFHVMEVKNVSRERRAM